MEDQALWILRDAIKEGTSSVFFSSGKSDSPHRYAFLATNNMGRREYTFLFHTTLGYKSCLLL
jgi:hypothetical protein